LSTKKKALREGSLIPDNLLDGEAMPRLISEARTALIGKTIKHVGYVYMDGQAWPCLIMEDGTSVLAQCDDEMNGPGVLNIAAETTETLLCEVGLTNLKLK